MQKHTTHKTAKGFTLIEMLIAIAIIGILAAIAIPLLPPVVENCHYLLASGPFLAHRLGAGSSFNSSLLSDTNNRGRSAHPSISP